MKHVLNIVLTIILAAGFWALMLYGETSWLEDKVVPVAGTKLPEWLEYFKWWATAGIFGALVLSSLLWYALGLFVFRFNKWSPNYRPIWLLLLIVPLILTVLSCLFTKQTQEGATWAYVFYILNNFLTYYLGTLLFSPPSVMYIPLGAKYVRRW